MSDLTGFISGTLDSSSALMIINRTYRLPSRSSVSIRFQVRYTSLRLRTIVIQRGHYQITIAVRINLSFFLSFSLSFEQLTIASLALCALGKSQSLVPRTLKKHSQLAPPFCQTKTCAVLAVIDWFDLRTSMFLTYISTYLVPFVILRLRIIKTVKRITMPSKVLP